MISNIVFNSQFWYNIIMFIVVLCVLGLSIWAFLKPCSEPFGGQILNANDCYNSPSVVDEEDLKKCIKTMNTLNDNINTQYWGQPGNRGLTYPGGPDGGSFGNSNLIN